jgi:hypothetical protein
VVEQSNNAKNPVQQIPGRALAALGRQTWLDRPSYRLEHALTFAFASLGRYRERISNLLHGTWLGHPLHPALTSAPVDLSETMLNELGDKMVERMGELRESALEKLRVEGRAALLRAL